MKKYNHFVNGKEMLPNGGEYFETENPYTCEKWAEIAKGNAHDVDVAVNVAKEAFENSWSKTKPTERGKLLIKLAELVAISSGWMVKLPTPPIACTQKPWNGAINPFVKSPVVPL